MPRSERLTVRLPADAMRLAEAYAADRGLPLASIARAALMAEVNRHAGRSHLLDQVWDLLEQRLPELIASAVQTRGNHPQDKPTVLSPSGEGDTKR